MHDHQDALEVYSRGLEYLDYNEPDQAILAFTEALHLNPQHVHAYFARGCAWADAATWKRRSPITTRPCGWTPTMPRPTATAPRP